MMSSSIDSFKPNGRFMIGKMDGSLYTPAGS